MLHINPKEFVNFNSKNAEATLNLKSIATSAVTYKVGESSTDPSHSRLTFATFADPNHIAGKVPCATTLRHHPTQPGGLH